MFSTTATTDNIHLLLNDAQAMKDQKAGVQFLHHDEHGHSDV